MRFGSVRYVFKEKRAQKIAKPKQFNRANRPNYEKQDFNCPISQPWIYAKQESEYKEFLRRKSKLVLVLQFSACPNSRNEDLRNGRSSKR